MTSGTFGSNIIKKEIEELCNMYIDKREIKMFLLEYIKKYYNESLVNFTKVYSDMFNLNQKEIDGTKLFNTGGGAGAKIITRCFISRVYWKKLLTGLHPHQKDQILIKCKTQKQKNFSTITIKCLKFKNNEQIDFDFDTLSIFLSGLNYNDKVISYTIHPDHEFNVLYDNDNLYLIQSWLFQYPLRIYHIVGKNNCKKFLNILNNFIIQIYKLNDEANDLNKLFFKLFMNYNENFYIIDDKKIIFRSCSDYYIFDMAGKKEFTKKMKIMINEFTFDNKKDCLKNLQNQNVLENQEGGFNNNGDNLDKSEYKIIKNTIDNLNKGIYDIATITNIKTAIFWKIIFSYSDSKELTTYFITIEHEEFQLNYIYYKLNDFEMLIKMEIKIFNLLLNNIKKYDKYLKKIKKYSNLEQDVFLLINLYFQQVLLTIDLDYSGHAYYFIQSNNLISINIPDRPINITYNKKQPKITKSIEFDKDKKGCNKTVLDKFVEFIMINKYNVAKDRIPCIKAEKSEIFKDETATSQITKPNLDISYDNILKDLDKISHVKDFDKYIENLDIFKIRDKIIEMCKKLDFLGLNLIYNKIAQKFYHKYNLIGNNEPIYFFVALYLHLLLYEGKLDEYTNKKYRTFINTLYKDISKELIMLETTGKINEYKKKYVKYKQKYLKLKNNLK